ncbi:2'-5' RNA ligase [Malonomonas rubra DSM 5091]|uniref:RNA 2',3'-cyclic phosphodiesterase n=1 Tax=Malonomonas rubra DSM 5091 TaxID=1122189 RepID=A0A1M6LQS5_MALRU|nr:RNA 2',3'-cyclic phosphodiesterase [Malonomonas rubra]SHJ73520.1 2'-5' RNA ligase [Malonomonas rubra DSM 5091]
MTELLRSFIAIPLPEQTRRRIGKLQQQLRALQPLLKTPRSENLHLTLNFLGDLTPEQLAEIGQHVLSIGQKKEIFNVLLKGLGFFPNAKRPRILWLGVEPEAELIALQEELSKQLLSAGLEIEQRRYRPHLTIGRFRQPPPTTEALCPFLSQSCGSMKIDRMILYTSKLTPKGAIHRAQTTAVFKQQTTHSFE